MLFKGQGELINKAWICNDCSFRFGAPISDSDTLKGRCPYCGSKNISGLPQQNRIKDKVRQYGIDF